MKKGPDFKVGDDSITTMGRETGKLLSGDEAQKAFEGADSILRDCSKESTTSTPTRIY